jgi:hypothetical protein
MDLSKVPGYVGSAVAILLGVAGRWNPPPITIDGDFSIALIVGGLAALGVTVGIPAVRGAAIREGEARGEARAEARATRRP